MGEAPEVVVQNGYKVPPDVELANCGGGHWWKRAPSRSAMALTPVRLWKSLERESKNEEGEYEEITKVKGLTQPADTPSPEIQSVYVTVANICQLGC